MSSPEALQVLDPYREFVRRPITEAAADLDAFHGLLTIWNRTHNLVSRETLGPSFWGRHVGDSLTLLPLLKSTDAALLDIGSGGGFPALPVAIALKGLSRRYRLIEANTRKASFLRTVVRRLSLPVTVITRRAERKDGDSCETPDVVTARAVAPLAELLGFALPYFGPATRGLFHKGREYGVELEAAAAQWRFDVLIHEQPGNTGGVLLEITNLQQNQ